MRHKKSNFLRANALLALSAIAIAIVSLPAAAQTAAQVQDAARQGDQRLRQEQERLRVEQERNRREQTPSGVDLKKMLPQVDASKAAGPCKNVSVITLKGAELMDLDDQESVAGKFTGRCLATADIEKLMGQVTQHYIERGFVTTRAYLPAQDLSGGKLELLVVEGRIERLVVDGDPQNRINLAWAVPAQAGDMLNIRDLEQAVDQINSVSANKVKLDILPGSGPGKSIVLFRNVAASPVGLEFASDNMGVTATGKNGLSATLTLGGLLGLNENLALTYRSSRPHSPNASSDSAAVGVTLPSGYATYSLSASVSNYSTGLLTALGRHMVASGKASTLAATADRVMVRDQESLHAVTASLSSTDGKNYLDDAYLQVNSRRAITLSVGLRSTLRVAGGNLSILPELAMGLNEMGNLPAGVNAASDGPQAQFTKFVANVNYDKRFKWADQSWGWNSSFKGQRSKDQLLGSQQLLIGGVPSIRGFVSNVVSGDTGYYWRNELALYTKFNVESMQVKSKFYAGYDAGYVESNSASGTHGNLSGYALGLVTNFKPATIDLAWTRASRLPDGMTREAAQTWVRVSFSL